MIKSSIAGTRLVGRMTVGNRNGLLLPNTTTDQELQHIRNSLPDEVVVQRIDERLSALGNCIACNDYVALIHPDIDKVPTARGLAGAGNSGGAGVPRNGAYVVTLLSLLLLLLVDGDMSVAKLWLGCYSHPLPPRCAGDGGDCCGCAGGGGLPADNRGQRARGQVRHGPAWRPPPAAPAVAALLPAARPCLKAAPAGCPAPGTIPRPTPQLLQVHQPGRPGGPPDHSGGPG